MKNAVFIGIDVAAARGCVYAVLDDEGRRLRDGWLPDAPGDDLARPLQALIDEMSSTAEVVHIGIDSPRQPLPAPRQWFWIGSKCRWRAAHAKDMGWGRHCEVVISAHRLANPQWTGPLEGAPPWMLRGFSLFAFLRGCELHEVFPTASYCLLSGDQAASVEVGFASCHAGPKDVLDAYVAAFTVREYVQGRGQAVGGGDGLGEIVLPRSIPNPIPEVLVWPKNPS